MVEAEGLVVGSLDERVVLDAVVKVAAKVLGRSTSDIQNDGRAWQVTFSSEQFDASYLPQVDWRTLTLSLQLERHPSLSRCDFDLARSSVWAANLLERDDVDATLKRFLEAEPVLYGKQIQKLLEEGRIDPTWLTEFEGCVRSPTETLIDNMRVLLILDDPKGRLAVSGRHAEVDPTYAELISSLGPQPLQDHVGLFFQTAYAARSEGMLFQSRELRNAMMQQVTGSVGMPFEPSPHDPDRATWADGEGLRSLVLSPRETSEPPLVPAHQ